MKRNEAFLRMALLLTAVSAIGCMGPYVEHRVEQRNEKTGEMVVATTKMRPPKDADLPSNLNTIITETMKSDGSVVTETKTNAGLSSAGQPDPGVGALWMLPWAGIVLFSIGLIGWGLHFKYRSIPLGWQPFVIIGGLVLFFVPKMVSEVGAVLSWILVGLAIATIIGFIFSWWHNRRSFKSLLGLEKEETK